MNQLRRIITNQGTLGLLAMVLAFLFISVPTAGQTQKEKAKADPYRPVRSSAAYAEVVLRETELRAEIEALSGEYTDEFPKLKEARFALGLVQKEKARLLMSDPAESEKLTLSLGKIMVRKVEAEVELWRSQQSLADSHPEVKRAKRKVDVFESAIKEILG